MKQSLSLTLLPTRLAILQLPPSASVPEWTAAARSLLSATFNTDYLMVREADAAAASRALSASGHQVEEGPPG